MQTQIVLLPFIKYLCIFVHVLWSFVLVYGIGKYKCWHFYFEYLYSFGCESHLLHSMLKDSP